MFASEYVELRTTTTGGRSIFAIRDIQPGTRIHSSGAPFAHVIYKEYRKEVCAQCFAYSASDETTATDYLGARRGVILTDGSRCHLDQEPKRNSEEIQITAGRGEAQAMLQAAIEPGDTPVNQTMVDQVWATAEALITSKAHLTSYFSTLNLEDTELEIARLLASAVVRRYSSDHLDPSGPASQSIPHNCWSQLLDLQINELPNVQRRPFMLPTHFRIFAFLCNALPKYLQPYMDTIREVLARDTGNSFGIWDGDRRDDMMGWGIWISASYFNHSCAPNLRKKRQGRVLHFETTREIQAGEELCISYIETDSPVNQRRRELEESWFFTCRCYLCEKESSL
ncbi:SET domain-containing protein [Melanogaster broomeanus]|nr:SET domain-containing protein [Melanogaster broomeanus]